MKIKSISFLFVLILVSQGCASLQNKSGASLKDALKEKFLIGTAMNAAQITGIDSLGVKVIKEQFNSITAENCMKSESIQPAEGKFDFLLADKFVKFGEENNMFVIGHTLIWHSQAPKWFFTDKEGKDVSREVMIERMKNHITTVVSRYKGKVKGWDVVNEAILDDGSWRESKFYKIIGEDYIKLAFQFAHEADPNAELYYNDFSMANEGKRNAVIKMVKKLKSEGVKIDGIGMQGHLTLEFPPISEFEKSIKAFSETGLKVMITELDFSALPVPKQNIGADVSANFEYQKSLNPYPDSLPDSVAKTFYGKYNDYFKLFLKYSDNISRVTLWGVSDANSWHDNWPIKGRTDYPLLFDRNYQPKPIVKTIIEEAKAIK
ncbi:Endo-1,4-beta-xylanase A [uncultured Paludibacter sp.]|uniref:Beta-xylanase n=1 Tax=uncultured Paludibacter sp. TaxID=497635 RepID=A0A653AK03_9BACT|nr:Endo-1,4-beta-xylanase A [uncultured Paludibacter sp.]